MNEIRGNLKKRFLLPGLLLGFSCAVLILSVGQTAAEEAKTGSEQSAAPAGILPIPNYEGDIWTRSYLTGDWGGKRTEWAEKGIQFEIDNVNWVDTVVSDKTIQSGKIILSKLCIRLWRLH